MWRAFGVVIIILGISDLNLVLGQATYKLEEEIPDIAKVFAGYRSGLAMFDMDSDGDLDCVTTVQEDYDDSVPSVTYVWLLKGVNGHQAKNVSFFVCAGNTPDEFFFKEKNGNRPLQTGKVMYSDYRDCLIIKLPYGNSEECMLWISWEAKNSLPKTCTDQYEDKCKGARLSYDEATCSPFL